MHSILTLYTDENGNVDVQFLMGKARVAPMKKLSLARLELTAIALAARLVAYVTEALHCLQFQRIHFFADSEIALCWI